MALLSYELVVVIHDKYPGKQGKKSQLFYLHMIPLIYTDLESLLQLNEIEQREYETPKTRVYIMSLLLFDRITIASFLLLTRL